MSKEKEARVRDELLQQLYTAVLRSSLAVAAAGARSNDAAAAAAVCANLTREDTLLLPSRGAASFRVLRELPPRAALLPSQRECNAHVYTLPADPGHAIAFALAALLTAAQGPATRTVCIVVPAHPIAPGKKSPRTLASWQDLAEYAARLTLPVLFVSLHRKPRSHHPDPRVSSPRYPTIPVDAADALAAYRVAYECLGRARSHGGPSHLEAVRVADTPEPLPRLEAMLRKRGCFTKAWQRSVERQVITDLAEQA